MAPAAGASAGGRDGGGHRRSGWRSCSPGWRSAGTWRRRRPDRTRCPPAMVRGRSASWPSQRPAMGRSASSAAWTTAPGCGSTSRPPAIRRCGSGIASRSGARCGRRPTARTAPTLRVPASRRRSSRVRCDRLAAAADADRLVQGIRADAGDALARALPEPAAGLAAGILIGLRERVDRALAADFTTTGLSHVVAISGWNIALVAGLVAALLGTWPRRRRAVATVAAIALYTVLAGASSSVLRAAVMAGVALLARETGRPGTAARALAWAVVLLLVVGPATVADVGFQLSAAATAGPSRLGHSARGPPPGAAAAPARVHRRGARRLARRAGGDPPDRPALLRPARPAVAAPQPRWSCRWCRSRWRPGRLPWSAASSRVPARRRSSPRCSACRAPWSSA